MIAGRAVPFLPQFLASAAADPERLRALIAEYSAFVWRSVVRLGVPRSEAEDVVSGVFVIASRKLADIEPTAERSFLYVTARRLASRARRSEKRRREVFDDDPPERLEAMDPAPTADYLVDRASARAQLDLILDSMPFELREIFVLFELEQMTMADIAETLDLPAGTVASRLRKARELFQAAIQRLAARNGRR